MEPLISKLKRRREKDFKEIYLKYYKLVHYVSLLIVKDEHIAEDIMQDTFVSFMNHIEDYDDNGKVKQYLTTISRNLSLNYIKKKSTINEIASEDIDQDISYTDQKYKEIEIKLTLKKTLSIIESEIVSLRVLFDYSFKDISEELNLSIGEVQAKYYKAINKLKEHFNKGGR
jgi:RNA polymerase sigma-70 factor (ECF subfamily)